MIRITRVEQTKKGRYALFCDEEFLFSMHADSFAICELTVGCTVTEERLEELHQEDELRSARDKALAILARAPQTAYGLYGKLSRHFGSEASEAAVARMVQLGLVNDLDYAGRCARDMLNLKGWSLRRIGQELRRRGIDEETAAQCLSQFEEVDPQQQLAELIRRKYQRYLQDEKGLRKTVNALLRFGYSYGDIRRAINEFTEYSEE